MLDVVITRETERVMRKVDRNKTMLIIGKDANRFAVNTIQYYDSVKKVLHDYGESELSNAFEVAKEFDAPHVFLLNIRNKVDHIDFVDVLKQYDFAYIVPVDLLLSDYFYDSNKNNRRMFYVKDYLDRASKYNNSVLIMTDKHASMYEDIDHYLREMKGYLNNVRYGISHSVKGNNIAFVANNLKDYKMSNVVLASILTASDPGDYPTLKKINVVFDIDRFDLDEHELIYFKKNIENETVVENLVNLGGTSPLLKSIYVDRIIKHIIRTLDMSELHGKLYRAHHKLQAERTLEAYFDNLVGIMIRSYKIESIQFIREGPAVGSLECVITIWIKSTSGSYSLVIGGNQIGQG